MRYCKNCGSIAASDDKFCVICGAKIDEEPEKPVEKSDTVLEHNDESTVSRESSDTQEAEKAEHVSEKDMRVQPVNPNLHDEYIDISSFYSEESVKKSPKPRIAPAPAESKSTTKVVDSISGIEAKTREIGSIKKKQYDASQDVIFENISSGTKKHVRISKGLRIAIIAVVAAVLLTVGISVAALIIKSSGPAAEDFYSSAQRKYSEEDYFGAIDDLSECVKLDATNISAYMLLADAYIATDREQEAVTVLESGYRETGSTTIKTKLDTLNAKVKADKIYSSLVSEGNGAVKNRDYNLAVTKFNSAIEARPDIAEPYILAADAYAAMKEYDKAVECLQNGLKKVNDKQLSSKIEEINAVVAKEKAEEESRLEEERKKAEQEQKEKEEREREERERIEKQPVKFETKIDEKTVDYKKTEIFSSEARWVVFDNEGRDLPGIDYANRLVNETLNSYYELDCRLFGAKDEKELYEMVKASNNMLAIAYCRVTVTYNKNGILSFVIFKYHMPPTINEYNVITETHTIDIKTGDEYVLGDILAAGSDVISIVKSQALLNNIDISDDMTSNMNFFLAGDSLIFYLKKSDWAYEQVPLPYSDTDKFAMKIEEDKDTTYIYLQ